MPDADGWFPDYRTPPADVRPEAVSEAPAAGSGDVDYTILGLVSHWRVVVAEMLLRGGVDLYDPVVRARPWPGVRTAIFALIDTPGSMLRAVLTK